MSGVPGMHDGLPHWAPELKPCGTLAAHRRHLRRGETPCASCLQANARAQQDRNATGYVRPSRPPRIHLAARSGTWCHRYDHLNPRITDDPAQVTCRYCRDRMTLADAA